MVEMYEKDGKFFKRDIAVEVDETEYLRWKVEELERRVKELENKDWCKLCGYCCPGPYLCPHRVIYPSGVDIGDSIQPPWIVTFTYN